ncbi:hypothetical protein D3C72_878930 [compost metagenome]
MTTMIHNETTGERTFRVPIAEPLPGGPYSEPGELEIELAKSGEARRVALRFFPTAFEFQAKLPKLCKDIGREDAVFDFGRAAQTARPVIVYEAIPPVRERVPANLRDLGAVAKFLDSGPALFNLAEYRVTAIEFEDGEKA